MADFFSAETFKPAFTDRPSPRISYGLHFPEAAAKHVKETFHASRVYIIASKSLSTNTDALERLKAALGDRTVGVRIGIGSHTPIADIVDIIAEVRPLEVDCLITLGAGSLTDGAKLVRFAIANDAYSVEDINTLWGGPSHSNPARRQDLKRPTIPLICIPTSLSGGEYQQLAGATEPAPSHAKRSFEPHVDPDLVIQDPELSMTTPEWVWLSTGIRAVDHCVETLCSLKSNEKGDREASQALSKLIPGLLRCKHSPRDLQARHQCQLGVVEAMSAVSSGVPLGASHAIGHQLGPLGVGHGETSCIMLPAVCKYNAAKGANNDRQALVRELLVREKTVNELLQAKGVEVEETDLADILDAVIRELGMPRTLKDVKVGREKLDGLAENSLGDIWIKTNPVPMTEKAQVMEVLEMVVGDV